MNIGTNKVKTIKTPTGVILTGDYSNGKLETLSIGDYGKAKNIKADFLGYTNEINGVPNGECMPLQEKWVVTVSTQYGCPEKCTFCDVHKLKFGGNATVDDMLQQIENAFDVYPDVKYTDRLNLHFARMGEPMFNFDNVYEVAKRINSYNYKLMQIDKRKLCLETVHPVLTTMMPKKISVKETTDNLIKWAHLKNDAYRGQANIQLSINSTCDEQRNDMFRNGAHSLKVISEICKYLPRPIGRKYTLNFALADGYETNGEKLSALFNPDYFMVKITPIHNNNATSENGIQTVDGYTSFTPYAAAEQSFKDAGFDVLVFVPSQDEEDGTITCGNAILSGSKVTNEVTE